MSTQRKLLDHQETFRSDAQHYPTPRSGDSGLVVKSQLSSGSESIFDGETNLLKRATNVAFKKFQYDLKNHQRQQRLDTGRGSDSEEDEAKAIRIENFMIAKNRRTGVVGRIDPDVKVFINKLNSGNLKMLEREVYMRLTEMISGSRSPQFNVNEMVRQWRALQIDKGHIKNMPSGEIYHDLVDVMGQNLQYKLKHMKNKRKLGNSMIRFYKEDGHVRVVCQDDSDFEEEVVGKRCGCGKPKSLRFQMHMPKSGVDAFRMMTALEDVISRPHSLQLRKEIRIMKKFFIAQFQSRQRAIKNWQKLKFELSVRLVFSGHTLAAKKALMSSAGSTYDPQEEDKKEQYWYSFMIINPFGKVNFAILLCNSAYFHVWKVVFWLRIAFGPYAVDFYNFKNEMIFEAYYLLMVVATRFFVGISVNEVQERVTMSSEVMYERSASIIFKDYFFKTMITDMISLVPIFIRLSITEEEFQENFQLYSRLWFLQIFRFFRWYFVDYNIKNVSNFALSNINSISIYLSLQLGELFNLINMVFFMVHIEICFWLAIGRIQREGSEFNFLSNFVLGDDQGWISNALQTDNGAYMESHFWYNYANAMDFIAVTISTVGYGNYASPGLTKLEMTFIFLIITINFSAFGVLLEAIFTFKIQHPIRDFKDEIRSNISEGVAELVRAHAKRCKNQANTLNTKKLEDLVTSKHFNSPIHDYKNPYFKLLTPQLKVQLVFACHRKFLRKFDVFFQDFDSVNVASTTLIRKLITHLEFQQMADDKLVTHPGKKHDHIYFILKGKVSIIDYTAQFNLSKLRSGSFFGEHLFWGRAMKSPFYIRSGDADQLRMQNEEDREKNKTRTFEKRYCNHFYILDKNFFWSLLQDYSRFRQTVQHRATMRRAYWLLIQRKIYFSVLKYTMKFMETNDIDVDENVISLRSYLVNSSISHNDSKILFASTVHIKTKFDTDFQFCEKNRRILEQFETLPEAMIPANCPKNLYRQALTLTRTKIRQFQEKLMRHETDLKTIQLALIQPSILRYTKIELPKKLMDPYDSNMRECTNILLPHLQLMSSMSKIYVKYQRGQFTKSMNRIKVTAEQNNIFELVVDYIGNKAAYDTPYVIRKGLKMAKSAMQVKRLSNKHDKNHDWVNQLLTKTSRWKQAQKEREDRLRGRKMQEDDKRMSKRTEESIDAYLGLEDTKQLSKMMVEAGMESFHSRDINELKQDPKAVQMIKDLIKRDQLEHREFEQAFGAESPQKADKVDDDFFENQTSPKDDQDFKEDLMRFLTDDTDFGPPKSSQYQETLPPIVEEEEQRETKPSAVNEEFQLNVGDLKHKSFRYGQSGLSEAPEIQSHKTQNSDEARKKPKVGLLDEKPLSEDVQEKHITIEQTNLTNNSNREKSKNYFEKQPVASWQQAANQQKVLPDKEDPAYFRPQRTTVVEDHRQVSLSQQHPNLKSLKEENDILKNNYLPSDDPIDELNQLLKGTASSRPNESILTNDDYAQTLGKRKSSQASRGSSRSKSRSKSRPTDKQNQYKKQSMTVMRPSEFLGLSKFKAGSNINYTLEDRQKLQTQIGPRTSVQDERAQSIFDASLPHEAQPHQQLVDRGPVQQPGPAEVPPTTVQINSQLNSQGQQQRKPKNYKSIYSSSQPRNGSKKR